MNAEVNPAEVNPAGTPIPISELGRKIPSFSDFELSFWIANKREPYSELHRLSSSDWAAFASLSPLENWKAAWDLDLHNLEWEPIDYRIRTTILLMDLKRAAVFFTQDQEDTPRLRLMAVTKDGKETVHLTGTDLERLVAEVWALVHGWTG